MSKRPGSSGAPQTRRCRSMVHFRSNKRQGPGLSAEQPQGPATASSHLLPRFRWRCQAPRGPERWHRAHTCGKCVGPPSSGKVRGWAGGAGWEPPYRSPRAGTECPTAAGRRGRGPGALGRAPPHPPIPPPVRRRSAARPLAGGAPQSPAPPRGPSASGNRRGPPLAPGRHLVEAVLAVGFRLHLHLHQHRVRPRHIAQHGWGRRCRHSRLLFGVRGAAASPPRRPSPGLGEAGPPEAAAPQTRAPRPAAPAPSPPPPRQPARSPARRLPGSPRRRRTPAARLPAALQGLLRYTGPAPSGWGSRQSRRPRPSSAAPPANSGVRSAAARPACAGRVSPRRPRRWRLADAEGLRREAGPGRTRRLCPLGAAAPSGRATAGRTAAAAAAAAPLFRAGIDGDAAPPSSSPVFRSLGSILEGVSGGERLKESGRPRSRKRPVFPAGCWKAEWLRLISDLVGGKSKPECKSFCS